VSDAGLSLFVAGSFLDATGIFLLLAPDLVPYRDPVSAWLRTTWRRIVERLRALPDRLLRRRRHVFAQSGALIAMAGGVSGKGYVSVGEGASPEEKIAYLLNRDRWAQERISNLETRLADVESRRLDELRAEVERHVSEAIAEAEGRYRPLRVGGGVTLIAGLVCLSLAAFV
jgi:uncharacterized protein YjeT (DUF2065 family)